MRARVLLICLGCLGCAGLEPPPPPVEAGVIVASFYPLAWMAERIGGDLFTVRLAPPPSADPSTWVPDDSALLAMRRAEVILVNGAGFEGWRAWAALPPTRLVDTSAGFRHRHRRYAGLAPHTHGPVGDHSHEGLDGHTWLDPQNAKAQATAVHAALRRRRPAEHDRLDAAHRRLLADLDAVHRRLEALAAARPELALVANHPAYGYLAERYGLRITSLDEDPATLPAAPAVARGCAAAAAGAGIMLWEGPPSPAVAAEWRARCGLESVVFAPGESAPAAGDLLSLMNANITRLERALGAP